MVSNAENEPSALALYAAALKKQESGDSRTALRILFDLFRVDPFHSQGLQTAAKLSDSLGSPQEAELFTAVADDPGDPQGLYNLGYAFVESGLPELAVRYLQICSHRRPEDPLVRYELAYAHFRSGGYVAATKLLKPLSADPALAGPESFAARLLLVESLVHQGQSGPAREVFDRLEPAEADPHAEPQLDAIADLLARAALFPDPADLSQRDWHFIEHGGVLLRLAPGDFASPPNGIASPRLLAEVLRRLSGLLGSLDLRPAEVQYLTPRTRSLAEALARSMDTASAPYTPHAHERTLIVLREPGEAEPFLSDLRNHAEGVDLFALFADPRRQYALQPEIIGLFVGELSLPWSADNDDSGEEIRSALAALDSDPDDLDALCRYYAPLGKLLVLGNYDRYPGRRILTPLCVH